MREKKDDLTVAVLTFSVYPRVQVCSVPREKGTCVRRYIFVIRENHKENVYIFNVYVKLISSTVTIILCITCLGTAHTKKAASLIEPKFSFSSFIFFWLLVTRELEGKLKKKLEIKKNEREGKVLLRVSYLYSVQNINVPIMELYNKLLGSFGETEQNLKEDKEKNKDGKNCVGERIRRKSLKLQGIRSRFSPRKIYSLKQGELVNLGL